MRISYLLSIIEIELFQCFIQCLTFVFLIDEGDEGDRGDADDIRSVVVKMVQEFVAFVQATFPTDSGEDFRVKDRVSIFLNKARNDIVTRPPFDAKAGGEQRFPEPLSIHAKAGLGNKRTCSTSVTSAIPPAEKTPKLGRATLPTVNEADEALQGIVGGVENAVEITVAPGGTMNAGTVVTNEQDVANHPPPSTVLHLRNRTVDRNPPPPSGATPKGNAKAAAWTATLEVPDAPEANGLSPSVEKRVAQYEELQNHFSVIQEEVVRMEEEKRQLEDKMALLRRATAEKERKKLEKKEEEERRFREKEREKKENALLDASMEKIRTARDEEMEKIARNSIELQRMRETAAQMERQLLRPDDDDDDDILALEDELELGAESEGFIPTKNKKKKSPTRRQSAKTNPTTALPVGAPTATEEIRPATTSREEPDIGGLR